MTSACGRAPFSALPKPPARVFAAGACTQVRPMAYGVRASLPASSTLP